MITTLANPTARHQIRETEITNKITYGINTKLPTQNDTQDPKPKKKLT